MTALSLRSAGRGFLVGSVPGRRAMANNLSAKSLARLMSTEAMMRGAERLASSDNMAAAAMVHLARFR
jgi:hypothetical protein